MKMFNIVALLIWVCMLSKGINALVQGTSIDPMLYILAVAGCILYFVEKVFCDI